jgi:hypothetical protein
VGTTRGPGPATYVFKRVTGQVVKMPPGKWALHFREKVPGEGNRAYLVQEDAANERGDAQHIWLDEVVTRTVHQEPQDRRA